MEVNFWDYHGLWFVLFMCFFPRLTMLFATVWGGFLWWVGWLFMPRLTVAIIASMTFWDANPVLVVFTWLWALSGEAGEKKMVVKTNNSPRSSYS